MVAQWNICTDAGCPRGSVLHSYFCKRHSFWELSVKSIYKNPPKCFFFFSFVDILDQVHVEMLYKRRKTVHGYVKRIIRTHLIFVFNLLCLNALMKKKTKKNTYVTYPVKFYLSVYVRLFICSVYLFASVCLPVRIYPSVRVVFSP